jgi:SAM-dependent methyltransferase
MIDSPTVHEIHRANSNFGQLQVLQLRGKPRRALFNDYLEQGAYDTETKQGLEVFSYLLHGLTTRYATDVHRVLCIGLGVGIVPMQLAQGGCRVDVVEINPAVVSLAEQFFGFDSEKLNVVIGDGRHFLHTSRETYDAIVLDACLGDSQPSHLQSVEAFTAMRDRLRPGGVLVMNCFGDFTPGRDFLVASLHKTLAEVFPHLRIHADSAPEGVANVFFAASTRELVLGREPAAFGVHPACRDRVKAAFDRVMRTDPAHGVVVTDDYNPIEYFDAANRERFRVRQASFMLRHGAFPNPLR